MRKARLAIRLSSHVVVEPRADGVELHHAWGTTSVDVRPEVCAVLLTLAGEALDAAAVAEKIAGPRAADDRQVRTAAEELQQLFDCLPFLWTRVVFDGPHELVAIAPISDRAPQLQPVELAAGSSVSLDRFAYLHRRAEAVGLCLESPLALHRAQLGANLAALLGRVAAAPTQLDPIGDACERAALQLLVAAKLLHAGDCTQAEDERLATWSFHDLLFHARSRPGRSDGLFGASFRHDARRGPLPAIAPSRSGPVIELPQPAFDKVVAADRSLTEVLESRKSIRAYGEPVTVEQLGELLYRSARTRRVIKSRGPHPYDGAEHPYPTGGLAADLAALSVHRRVRRPGRGNLSLRIGCPSAAAHQ